MFNKLKAAAKSTAAAATNVVEQKLNHDLNNDGKVGGTTDAPVSRPKTQYNVQTPALRTGGAATTIDHIVEAFRRDRDAQPWEGVSFTLSEGNKVTVIDTPQLWGASATAPTPSVGSQVLLNAITSVIAEAKNVVDMSTLWWIGVGMPDGEFERAIARGLAQCQARVVRFIVGIPTGTITKDADIEAWIKRVTPTNAPFSIHIGRTRHSNPLVQSWTHAKIIAADGKRCVVGGHNLWDGDYLKSHPVHDLSCLFEGPAARAAHAYCCELWATSVNGEVISMRNGVIGREGAGGIAVPDEIKHYGNNRTLALGRMGAFVPRGGGMSEWSHGTDAAVSARILAICSAKSYIRVSQQALGFMPAINGGFDFATMLALCAAAKDGCTIDVIVSADTELVGYNGHLKETIEQLGRTFALCIEHPELVPPRNDFAKWLALKQDCGNDLLPTLGNKVAVNYGLKTDDAIGKFNQRFNIAPLHYAPGQNYWIVNGAQKLAANHCKVYVIDDKQFFVGSDNWYVSGSVRGLEEFGYLVEGEAVATFLQQYWTPAWLNSAPHIFRPSKNMF